MKPTLIQQAQTVYDAANKTTPVFNVLAGDTLVAYCTVENYSSTTPNSPTITDSSGLVWTQVQTVLALHYAQVIIWTAVANANTSMSVTYSLVQGSMASYFGGNVLTFRNSDGIGSSAQATGATGNPIITLSTIGNNSALVVVNGDWNAVDGASRAWTATAGTITELTYGYFVNRYTTYGVYIDDLGLIGSKTAELLAPAGQTFTIAAVEILGSTAPLCTPLGASLIMV